MNVHFVSSTEETEWDIYRSKVEQWKREPSWAVTTCERNIEFHFIGAIFKPHEKYILNDNLYSAPIHFQFQFNIHLYYSVWNYFHSFVQKYRSFWEIFHSPIIIIYALEMACERPVLSIQYQSACKFHRLHMFVHFAFDEKATRTKGIGNMCNIYSSLVRSVFLLLQLPEAKGTKTECRECLLDQFTYTAMIWCFFPFYIILFMRTQRSLMALFVAQTYIIRC